MNSHLFYLQWIYIYFFGCLISPFILHETHSRSMFPHITQKGVYVNFSSFLCTYTAFTKYICGFELEAFNCYCSLSHAAVALLIIDLQGQQDILLFDILYIFGTSDLSDITTN